MLLRLRDQRIEHGGEPPSMQRHSTIIGSTTNIVKLPRWESLPNHRPDHTSGPTGGFLGGVSYLARASNLLHQAWKQPLCRDDPLRHAVSSFTTKLPGLDSNQQPSG